MIKQIFFTALLSGLLAGGVLTAIQSMGTIPLILEAEKYEDGALVDYTNNQELTLTHDEEEEEEEAWSPKDGAQRLFFTFLTNIFLATGFSFLLCVVYLYLKEVTLLKGLISAGVGYLTFFVLPSIGLTPEVPGTLAASLEARQLWWVSTVLASAIGFGVLFFNKSRLYQGLALVLILVPHIVGAPHAEYHAGTAPIEIFHSFVQASFVTNGLFWLVLGLLSASLYNKFRPQNI